MATVSWATPEAPHIALQVTSALANNSNLVAAGNLNPSGYLYSSWNFSTKFHVAPTTGGSVDLYLVPSIDGSTFGTAGVGVTPSPNTFVGSFPIYPNANSGMEISLLNIPLTPLLLQPVIRNSTGQTIPASSGILTVRLYKEQIS